MIWMLAHHMNMTVMKTLFMGVGLIAPQAAMKWYMTVVHEEESPEDSINSLEMAPTTGEIHPSVSPGDLGQVVELKSLRKLNDNEIFFLPKKTILFLLRDTNFPVMFMAIKHGR